MSFLGFTKLRIAINLPNVGAFYMRLKITDDFGESPNVEAYWTGKS